MKTKLNLVQIYNAKEALEKFSANNLPIRVAYDLLKLRRVVETEFSAAEEQRNNLIKKYDPTGIRVPEDKIQDFIKDFNEFLVGVEVDVEFNKIPIDSLSDDIKLRAEDIARLDFLFDGVEEYNNKKEEEKQEETDSVKAEIVD